MKSSKPVKKLEDLMGKKQFFFPDTLSNERVGNDNHRCIMIRINGTSHFILTGVKVTITPQEFAILKDSGMVSDVAMYSVANEFDPLRPYENKIA